jgi:hypothetical protein
MSPWLHHSSALKTLEIGSRCPIASTLEIVVVAYA